MIDFNCPICAEKIEVPDSLAGQSLNCPSCNKSAIIPKICSKEKIKKKAANVFIRIWKNSPAPFRIAFLATMGVICAVLISLLAYSHLFAGEVRDIEKCRLSLEQEGLFYVEGPISSVFRGRKLDAYFFASDANNFQDCIVVYTDISDIVVGIAACWDGNISGSAADIIGDPAAYNRYNKTMSGFLALVKYPLYFPPHDTAWTINKDRNGVFTSIDNKTWNIQINRSPSDLLGTKNHKEMSDFLDGDKTGRVYRYMATAQTW
jgi:hypothetical protein